MLKKLQRHRKLQSILWIYFFLFSAVVLTIMFILQFYAFDENYKELEIQKIQNLGTSVTETWSKVRFSQPVSIKQYQNQATIYIFNAAGLMEDSEVLQLSDPDPLSAVRFRQRYELHGEGEYLDQVKDSNPEGNTYLIYGNKILNPDNPGSSIYIYIISAMGPRDIVKDILFRQFFTIALMMLLTALIISYVVAHSISSPLEKIAREATTLADRNYDLHFDEDRYLEVKQLSDSLNYATTELIRLDQVRDEVMSSVSHDLRTPLTVIKAYTEMLRDFSGQIPSKREEHTGVILNEVAWMSNMVEEILEYSKYRYGNDVLEIAPFDLNAMTRNCIQDIQATPLGSNVLIILHNSDIPLVLGDERRIQRVLHNLMGNAIKHNPVDEALSISLSYKDGFVRWGIEDHGPGISEEEQKLIWKKYYTKGDTPQKGFGLGLAIVKGILEAHGAEYGIDSEVNQGCEFWFRLKTEDVNNPA